LKINHTRLNSFLAAAFIFIIALVNSGCHIPEGQHITSFVFKKEDTGLSSNMTGKIDHRKRTITFTTQNWINNIEKLPAVFTLDENSPVFVNGIEQKSGITQNDFRKDVVYRLNENVAYTVIIVSPQATGLPFIKIDTVNSAPIHDRETWVTMTFSLSDPNNPMFDIPSISNQQIRGRGNSSWDLVPLEGKKPYRIRFRDNQQQSFFGLPAARNWVLLRYPEINTPFGFELGKRLDLEYTCSYNHVHLFINGNYRGLYLFTEHRQADPAEQGAPGRPKVDLNDGWFVEIDRLYDEEPKFRTTNYNLPVIIKSPEPSGPLNMTNPAYEFIRTDLNQLADLMASDSFPENGYRNLIDLDTFVKYFIVQTVVMNIDLFRPGAETGHEIGSTFFYKDKGGIIGAGPIWDLNWTLSPWAFQGRAFEPNSFPYQIHPWFSRFHEDPVFLARYKEIWNKNFQSNILTMSGFIDDMGAKIRSGMVENKKRWSDEIDIEWHIRHIKDYSSKRAAFLNTEYNKVHVLPASKGLDGFGASNKNFGSASTASAQTFTLVAFGEMTDLSAALQRGNNSAFEIITPLTQVQTANEEGGYLATITIKPKTSLASGTHTDTLVLKGSNQGRAFTFNVSLTCTQ